VKKIRLVWTAVAAVFIAVMPKAALAGSISGVDTSNATNVVVGIFQVFIGIIGLGVIVHGAYEGFAQRKIIMAVVEVVLGLILCVVAFSAQALATSMGIMGALLR
jgi:hypothetical protein